MAKLIIKAPGAPSSEYELKPGANSFGRSLNNDFPIHHPSVSSIHCEIIDTDGFLVVHDLGSTTLTLVARLAGLLFYTTKKRLGWPMGRE